MCHVELGECNICRDDVGSDGSRRKGRAKGAVSAAKIKAETTGATLVVTGATLVVTSALLVVTRTLLGTKGIATRSKNATSSSWPYY